MVFLTYEDIFPIFLVTVVYSLVATAHRILLPQMYCSLFLFKYEGEVKKTGRSSAIRILFTILLTIIFIKFFDYAAISIYLGVFIACFLNVWPAIVQYRLIKFYKSKEKIILLVGYISFVVFSVYSSYLTVNFLIPCIFNDKKIFILDNEGINIIITIILYITPITLERILAKFSAFAKGVDLDTYLEEIKVVNNMLYLERDVLVLYEYEIDKICKENNIPVELLQTIICLEYIYRGRWYFRIGESLVCHFFPFIAIKKDISVGITQIKISTAKDILKMSPTKFIKQLLEPEFNMNLCAIYLKNIIIDYYESKNKKNVFYDNDEEEFEEETEEEIDEEYEEDGDIESEDIFNYLAYKYLCEHYNDSNRTVLVYSSILRNKVKIIKQIN